MNTLEQIIKIINDSIKKENQGIKYHNLILEVLKKYNGKKPTKRIANELQSKLTMDKVFFKTEIFGQNYIEIWIDGDYKNRQRHFMGYKDSTRFGQGDTVDIDKFESNYDICYGQAAIERNQKRQKLLDNAIKLQQIADSIDNLNNAIKVYGDTVKYGEIEDYFSIERLVSKKLENHKE